MPGKEQAIPLKDRLDSEISLIKDKITTSDRRKFMEDYDGAKEITKQFLSNYLNGRGADTQILHDLLVFMRERIQKREASVAVPL
ncbi:MAG: hypothetical protein V4594_16765 [Bacteroidota bacterium]